MAVAVISPRGKPVPQEKDQKDWIDHIMRGLSIANTVYGIKHQIDTTKLSEKKLTQDAADSAARTAEATRAGNLAEGKLIAEGMERGVVSEKGPTQRGMGDWAKSQQQIDKDAADLEFKKAQTASLQSNYTTDPYTGIARPRTDQEKLDLLKSQADLNRANAERARRPLEKDPLAAQKTQAEIDLLKANTKKALLPPKSGGAPDPFNALPKDKQEYVKQLTQANAKRSIVVKSFESILSQLNDPSISDDDKVTIGQGALKLLNSPENPDAVGKEESERIGGRLVRRIIPRGLTGDPGEQFGRDLGGFARQVENKMIQSIKAAEAQQKEIDGMVGRSSGGASLKAPQDQTTMTKIINGVTFKKAPGGWIEAK